MMIDDILQDNDELTARQIRSNLEAEFSDFVVSLATVKRVRKRTVGRVHAHIIVN